MIKVISKCFVCLFVSLSLIIFTTPFKLLAEENCSSCRMEPSEIIEEYVDENNSVVIKYQNGIEAIYKENGEILVRDYYNVYGAELTQQPQSRATGGWIVIGIAIIGTVIDKCQDILYVSGHDVCRIVLNSLKTSAKPKARYELTGRYIPGYIPGCEPRHSGPCNAGYWEYKIVKL